MLISAVNKSNTHLPLVFFNNCLDNGYSNSELNTTHAIVLFCIYSLVTIDFLLGLVWKVARYTSAVPVFFSACDNYVDGGVKANNPTTFGLAEIQEFLAKKHGYTI